MFDAKLIDRVANIVKFTDAEKGIFVFDRVPLRDVEWGKKGTGKRLYMAQKDVAVTVWIPGIVTWRYLRDKDGNAISNVVVNIAPVIPGGTESCKKLLRHFCEPQTGEAGFLFTPVIRFDMRVSFRVAASCLEQHSYFDVHEHHPRGNGASFNH